MAQLIFIIISVAAFGKAWQNFMTVRRNILLGQDEKIEGNTAERWRNVLLIALGQRKMFKLTIAAVLHLFIYVAFLFTQVELIEILIDGAFGVHRFFAPYLGILYPVIISTIEILSVLAFVATVAFLSRRYFLKVERFQKPELKGFPMFDATLILVLELTLIFAIFSMNGADAVLQTKLPEKYHHVSPFAISSWLGPSLLGRWDAHLLVGLERFGWWLHYFVVLAFLNYLPFSKHLHIILAFPNTFFAKLNPRGEISNMPIIMNEVRTSMGLEAMPNTPVMQEGEMPTFGANDIFSLSWKNLMDAYTCTECGRCTASCPANLTGKKLSPRKIMMDVRDRVEEVGKSLDSGDIRLINKELYPNDSVLTAQNFADGKTLFDRISKEEIHACTTCNACVEACPVLINPLDIILQLRRYEILTLSEGPKDWTPMFTSLENSGVVWQMPVEREAWVRDVV
ncbi:MAG: (Fe-S)-binding protein [Saprospiraceae bacterium]|nr:(Fe-S)-binding protein [Saprospiraceae bacterium]